VFIIKDIRGSVVRIMDIAVKKLFLIFGIALLFGIIVSATSSNVEGISKRGLHDYYAGSDNPILPVDDAIELFDCYQQDPLNVNSNILSSSTDCSNLFAAGFVGVQESRKRVGGAVTSAGADDPCRSANGNDDCSPGFYCDNSDSAENNGDENNNGGPASRIGEMVYVSVEPGTTQISIKNEAGGSVEVGKQPDQATGVVIGEEHVNTGNSDYDNLWLNVNFDDSTKDGWAPARYFGTIRSFGGIYYAGAVLAGYAITGNPIIPSDFQIPSDNGNLWNGLAVKVVSSKTGVYKISETSASDKLGEQLQGARGIVKYGPETRNNNDDYKMWYVDFDNSDTDGWVDEVNLGLFTNSEIPNQEDRIVVDSENEEDDGTRADRRGQLNPDGNDNSGGNLIEPPQKGGDIEINLVSQTIEVGKVLQIKYKLPVRNGHNENPSSASYRIMGPYLSSEHSPVEKIIYNINSPGLPGEGSLYQQGMAIPVDTIPGRYVVKILSEYYPTDDGGIESGYDFRGISDVFEVTSGDSDVWDGICKYIETPICVEGSVKSEGTNIGACEVENSSCVGGQWQVTHEGVSAIDEICDGLDNNCNGLVDESSSLCGETQICHEGQCQNPSPTCGDSVINGNEDCDGNVLGGKSCTNVGNYVRGNLSCNLDCTFNKSQCQISCIDVDRDGYMLEGSANSCVRLANFVGYNDCNDNNAGTHPGASEICDGKDNNCNGQIDEGLDCRKKCKTNSDCASEGENYICGFFFNDDPYNPYDARDQSRFTGYLNLDDLEGICVACTPESAADTCLGANSNSCGIYTNNCGQPVDCDVITGGCDSSTESCSAETEGSCLQIPPENSNIKIDYFEHVGTDIYSFREETWRVKASNDNNHPIDYKFEVIGGVSDITNFYRGIANGAYFDYKRTFQFFSPDSLNDYSLKVIAFDNVTGESVSATKLFTVKLDPKYAGNGESLGVGLTGNEVWVVGDTINIPFTAPSYMTSVSFYLARKTSTGSYISSLIRTGVPVYNGQGTLVWTIPATVVTSSGAYSSTSFNQFEIMARNSAGTFDHVLSKPIIIRPKHKDFEFGDDIKIAINDASFVSDLTSFTQIGPLAVNEIGTIVGGPTYVTTTNIELSAGWAWKIQVGEQIGWVHDGVLAFSTPAQRTFTLSSDTLVGPILVYAGELNQWKVALDGGGINCASGGVTYTVNFGDNSQTRQQVDNCPYVRGYFLGNMIPYGTPGGGGYYAADHTYETNGTFNLSVNAVSNVNLLSGMDSKHLQVRVVYKPLTISTLGVRGYTDKKLNGLKIKVDGGAPGPDAIHTTVNWGDGTPNSEEHLTWGEIWNPTHTYGDFGNWNPEVTVEDSVGQKTIKSLYDPSSIKQPVISDLSCPSEYTRTYTLGYLTCTFKITDPLGRYVYYMVDWDGDGVVDYDSSRGYPSGFRSGGSPFTISKSCTTSSCSAGTWNTKIRAYSGDLSRGYWYSDALVSSIVVK